MPFDIQSVRTRYPERVICYYPSIDSTMPEAARLAAAGCGPGTVVIAEGLSELLPDSFLKNLPRDEHGHLSLGRINLGSLLSQMVSDRYHAVTGRLRSDHSCAAGLRNL